MDDFTLTLTAEEQFTIGMEEIPEDELNLNLEHEIVEIPTGNYNDLDNKPQINNVELSGNKSLDDLNIQVKGNYADDALTNLEIEALINGFV